jgi:hypothetical protein
MFCACRPSFTPLLGELRPYCAKAFMDVQGFVFVTWVPNYFSEAPYGHPEQSAVSVGSSNCGVRHAALRAGVARSSSDLKC